jgi:hypothetical protein
LSSESSNRRQPADERVEFAGAGVLQQSDFALGREVDVFFGRFFDNVV